MDKKASINEGRKIIFQTMTLIYQVILQVQALRLQVLVSKVASSSP